MLQRRRFGSIEEVIAATEAYFEAKDAWYRNCIPLQGDYLMNKNEFCQTDVVFLVT